MQPLYLLTSNMGKLREAQTFLPELQGLNVDLVEIQSIHSEEVIRHKLDEARTHHQGRFIVEDTALDIDAMNGLPGRFIKQFEKTIGLDGIAKIAHHFGTRATASCTIGYFDGATVHFFEGSIKGTIVEPRGTNGFGWDNIFIPDGHTKTFGEMRQEEKDAISMRKNAFEQLKEHLHHHDHH